LEEGIKLFDRTADTLNLKDISDENPEVVKELLTLRKNEGL